MILHAFTDGASRGNPGESGIGLLVRTAEGDLLFSMNGYIGKATNNVAEYTALLTLLQNMKRATCTRLVIHSDSELMVRQMNGRYKVKDGVLKSYHAQATRLIGTLPFAVELKHIPREENRDADKLANAGIDARSEIAVQEAGASTPHRLSLQ